jgi:acid phosphatase
MKKYSLLRLSLVGLGLLTALAGCGHHEVSATAAVDATVDPRLKQINHFVVIYLENRSFDHLFGNFPGANGRENAGDSSKQLDKNGVELKALPPVYNMSMLSRSLAALNKEKNIPSQPDPRFPPANGDAPLPNAPFDIGRYVPPDQATGDLKHSFYNSQLQIDSGQMNRFVAYCDAGGLTMGYYDLSSANGGKPTNLWNYAQQYTLADNFFQAAHGGSFLNHQWLVAARMPEYPGQAPAKLI